MAKPLVDISIFGDKALARDLARFEPRVQKKVVRPALRRSAKRVLPYIVQAVSGTPIQPRRGFLLAGMASAQIKALKRSRTVMGAGVVMPTREQLGISPDDKFYWPFALEFGYTRTKRAPVTVQPFRYMRGTVDQRAPAEHTLLRADIGKGIEREAKRSLGKK